MSTRHASRRRLRMGVAVLAVVSVITAGCGDDDGASEADAAFIADYEQVTATFEERTDAVRTQGQDALGQGSDAVLEVYEQLLEATREAHERYAELGPAEDVRGAYDKLVAELEHQTEILSGVVAAATDGDDAELARRLQELATVVVEVTSARRTLDRQIDELEAS